MTISSVSDVKICGIASAVPELTRSFADEAKVFGEENVAKIAGSTGIQKRHVSSSLCASDLCFAAAERLLEEAACNRDSIDALVFVSQTPDYILPATSCSLHNRLNLSKGCAAFDLNLGCSGYVYGLWVVSNLIAGGSVKKALLLAGDTITRLASPLDRSVALLFGDAGTATLLEKAENESPITFVLGTNGSGRDNLIVPAGGFRRPLTNLNMERTEREGGNIRSDADLFMNGAEIFSFTLDVVPSLVKRLLAESGWNVDDVDAFVMHQANRFMLQHLSKRMKLPKDKVVLAMENYGNTSLASIPLAMTTCLADRLKAERLRLLLAGFGVGYSWGGALLSCGEMYMPELVLVPENLAEEDE